MTKQEIREQVFAIYKKIYKTDEKPTVLGLAQMASVLANAIQVCPDSEKELGTEVYNLIKRCTKVKRSGIDVDVTKLLTEIDYYEK